MSLFAGAFNCAEFENGLAAGLIAIHAGGDVLLRGLFDMKGEFYVNVVAQIGGIAALEEEAKSGKELGDHEAVSGARPPPARTRPMAEERRSQVFNSASSCFFPARVRE